MERFCAIQTPRHFVIWHSFGSFIVSNRGSSGQVPPQSKLQSWRLWSGICGERLHLGEIETPSTFQTSTNWCSDGMALFSCFFLLWFSCLPLPAIKVRFRISPYFMPLEDVPSTNSQSDSRCPAAKVSTLLGKVSRQRGSQIGDLPLYTVRWTTWRDGSWLPGRPLARSEASQESRD